MNSRNRTSIGKCSVKSRKSPISSSLIPRSNTQFNFTLKKSSAATRCKASMTRACHSAGLRAKSGNLAATRVSRLILIFRRPAAVKCGMNFFSRTALVVMPKDKGSGKLLLKLPRCSTMWSRSPRMVGSPPVRRTFLTPRPTKTDNNVFNSSVFRRSGFAFGVIGSSPSSGMQYLQRRLHRSVREIRKYLCLLPKLSINA
mmetsp:Transcript_87857/g.138686  ORF Transcript_87857/g.138686 Transcript_87857/m.138686 type:complete len:200 (+) Transcript_87857:491-1090(+)